MCLWFVRSGLGSGGPAGPGPLLGKAQLAGPEPRGAEWGSQGVTAGHLSLVGFFPLLQETRIRFQPHTQGRRLGPRGLEGGREGP